MSKTNEPFWWSLFGAGGVMAALFIPVMIFLTGMAGVHSLDDSTRHVFSYEKLQTLFSHWLTKLFLLVVISLSFFHCGHRIRHTLVDVGLKGLKTPLMFLCYGGALAGGVICAILLWRI